MHVYCMIKLLLYTSNSLSMTYLSSFETHTIVKRGEGFTFLLSRSGGIDDGVNPFGLYFELGLSPWRFGLLITVTVK